MSKKRVGTPKNPSLPVIKVNEQSVPAKSLTKLEKIARKEMRQSIRVAAYGSEYGNAGGTNIKSADSNFYSPQLSTDFLELPQSEREKRELYRFWYTTHPIVGSAIDFHTDVPMSKIRLSLPKGKDVKRNKQILHFYNQMCSRIKLFQNLYDATHEYWLHGNCVPGDSRIRVEGGYVNASDVRVGDRVLTHAGRFKSVIKTCSRHADEILSFDVWKSSDTLRCTAEHPVEVLRDGKFAFIRADEICDDDFIRVTWPTEEVDVDSVDLLSGAPARRISDHSYEVVRKYPRTRSKDAQRARDGLIFWLSSLRAPTVRSRKDLASDFGVSESTLNNVVLQLGKELGIKFHRRVGHGKFGGGSAVEWIPTDSVGTPDVYDRGYTFLSPDRVNIDADFAYLVGYWLGDGTLGRDASRNTWGRGLWQIVFGKESDRQCRKVIRILTDKFGSDNVRVSERFGITTVRLVSSPAFVEWWSDNFGDTSHGSSPKRVPEWFSSLPANKIVHAVAGLIDSDGCIGQSDSGLVKFSVSSRPIASFFRDACFRLGAVGNTSEVGPREVVGPDGQTYVSRPMYSVTFLDDSSCSVVTAACIKEAPVGQRYSNSSPYFRRVDGKLAFKVRSISVLPGCEVFNFEVEEDHTYQVNGFSTHNCFIFAEDHDLSDEIPEHLIADVEEEEVGEIDYAGRSSKKTVRKKTLKPESDRAKNIREFVQTQYEGWQRLQILPPEQVKLEVFQYTNRMKMELIPSEKDRLLVMRAQDQKDEDAAKIADDIPEQIRENLLSGQPIPLNTSPYDDFLCSSFCYHLSHKKSAYDDRGISLLERCLRTLLYQDKLRQAQTSIASRAMTPKRVVWADKMSEPDTDALRDQVDQALIDPDFTIVTNFEVHWDEIGSRDRLLDLSSEYEMTNKLLFIGLRITESMLTGESSYAGERVHLDVMNTMYLLYRERIAELVEENLFKPVAEKKGFWEEDEYGNRVLLYPQLQFTRLALRDNTELQDYMFNLYQKGSLPISFILDLLNIDSDDALEQLKKDMFTPNDSTFNEFLKNVLTKAGDDAVEKTDVLDRIISSVGLKRTDKKGDRFGKSEES